MADSPSDRRRTGTPPQPHRDEPDPSFQVGWPRDTGALRSLGAPLQPFSAQEMASLCDASTADMHREALEQFRSAGGAAFTLACSRNTLDVDGLHWVHPAHGGSGEVHRTRR
ncbi:MAG: hypothetical protein M5U19_11375 [Microthrixaceae bacterium]|nr:hypothetical protein [Microthrixaceae bacterium]